MSEYLNKATEYIYNNVKNSQSVLVVCHKGKKKCLVLILAYLIKYCSLNKEMCIKIIRTKIIDAFNDGIYGEPALNYFINFLKK